MSDKTDLTPPEETGVDKAAAIVSAAISDVPLPGTSAAAELLARTVKPGYERRLHEWRESVAQAIRDLEERVEGFSIDSLAGNQEFLTAFAAASNAAVRAHQEEKLDALRNAVSNVAAGSAPGDDLQLMFLWYVDTLPPFHIRLLRFWQDPRACLCEHGLTPDDMSSSHQADTLTRLFPESKGMPTLIDVAHSQLAQRGLVPTHQLALAWPSTAHQLIEEKSGKNTTELGDQFLQFITDPLEAQDAAT